MKVSCLMAFVICLSCHVAFAKKAASASGVKPAVAPASPVGKYNQDVNGKCRDLPGHSVCGKYCCINDR